LPIKPACPYSVIPAFTGICLLSKQMTQEVQEETSCRGLGCPTESEIPLESPFAEVGVGDRVQGEVLPGV
jgi:hypothetical protein